MTSPKAKPIELLYDLEQRSNLNAQGLPQKLEIKSTWDGIGFRLAEQQLVAPVGAVREILIYPSLARVPGAKEWVRGIANVRGNLLPIFDLGSFLGCEASQLRRSARVLTVQHKGVSAGLLVDEVLGLRHFLEEEYVREVPGIAEQLRSYLRGGYRQEGAFWAVFDLKQLVESPEFKVVAA